MKRFSFSSLRVRLTLIVVIAVIPALGLIIYNASEQRRQAIHEAQENTLRLARIAGHLHGEIIEDTRIILTTLAQLPEVRESNLKKCNALMANLIKKYPNYVNLGLVRLDGYTVCNAFDPQSRAYAGDRNWFKGAIKKKDFSIGEYVVGRIMNKAVLVCGYPVLDSSGKIQSVVFAAIDLTWFNRFAAEVKMVPGATFVVLDRDGAILARHPDPEKWTGQKIPDPLLKEIITRHEGLTEASGLDGAMRVYAFLSLSGIPIGNVYVKIGIPKDRILSSVNRNLIRNLIMLGFIFISVLLLAWMGGNVFILRQVNTLLEATKRLSDGDLSVRMRPRHIKGELNQLADGFDRMAEALERRETERKQAEEALKASERKLHTVMDQAADAFFIHNTQGQLVDVNRRACQSLGYTREDLLSKTIADIDPEAIEARKDALWNKVIAGEVAILESHHKRKDGDTFPVEVSLGSICLGPETLILAISRDITERKQAEEEIKRSRDQLRTLSAHLQSLREEERAAIAREIHDELGQALTGLKMDLSWLDKRLPKKEELIEKTQSMLKLVDSTIQTVRKISTELRPGILDDLGIIAAIEWQAKDFENRTGIKCEFQLGQEKVDLDRDRSTAVFRIFQETLTNVVRHAQASKVKIELEVIEGNLLLKVFDNGLGIRERDILNPKSLGLLGMRERAHIFGGEVEIKGKHNEGTMVTVKIPMNK